MAAVINYICPTPNTNIVIFGGGGVLDLFRCGGPRNEMNGLSSWSFAGDREEGTGEGRTWTGPALESRVYRETPVWVSAGQGRVLSPAVRNLN